MSDINFTINTTNMQGFLISMNDMSGGFFLNVVPFMIFIIVLISFIKFEYQPRDAILYANVVALLIAILLRSMDALSDIILMVFVAGMIINIILLVKDQ